MSTARSLAYADHAKVVLVHVNEVMLARGGRIPVHLDEDERLQKVRAQLAYLQVAAVDAELDTPVTYGHVAPAIARAAEGCCADVVIVGRSRRRRVADFLFGSMAQRLARLTSCCVLVIPRGRISDDARPTLVRIADKDC